MKTLQISTIDAFRQIIRCHIAIVLNTWRSINFLVTKRSWLTISAVILIAITISAVNIMQARAERDAAVKKQVELQNQVEQLSCVVESERRAK